MNERETQQSSQSGKNKGRISNRRTILWAVCGLYLIYLAYGLLKSYFTGVAAPNEETLCVVAGSAFAVIGLVMIVMAARQGFQAMRENAAEMARIEEEDRQAEEAKRLREADADEDDDDVTEADEEMSATEDDRTE